MLPGVWLGSIYWGALDGCSMLAGAVWASLPAPDLLPALLLSGELSPQPPMCLCFPEFDGPLSNLWQIKACFL